MEDSDSEFLRDPVKEFDLKQFVPHRLKISQKFPCLEAQSLNGGKLSGPVHEVVLLFHLYLKETLNQSGFSLSIK